MPKIKKNSLDEVKEILLSAKLIITEKNNKPCIEIRKTITDYPTIKKIVSCAYHRVPVTLMIEFTNTLQSISSLVEKGIIYKGENNQFFFTF